MGSWPGGQDHRHTQPATRPFAGFPVALHTKTTPHLTRLGMTHPHSDVTSFHSWPLVSFQTSSPTQGLHGCGHSAWGPCPTSLRLILLIL